MVTASGPGDYFFWDEADPILPADEISHYVLIEIRMQAAANMRRVSVRLEDSAYSITGVVE